MPTETDAGGSADETAAGSSSDLPEKFPSRAEILEDLHSRGFRFQGKRGQNFLFDGNLLRALVTDSGVGAGDRVLEVGAGAGTLTRVLLERGCEVVSVEIDAILAAFLRDRLPHPRLRLLEMDVLAAKNRLNQEVVDILDRWPQGFHLVANLPYAIASPLVALLVEGFLSSLKGFSVLVQEDLAKRWEAPPGGAQYGPISVLLRLCGEGRRGRRVPRHLFTPAPQVESCVFNWHPSDDLEPLPAALMPLVRRLFQQRRKTLGSLLKAEMPPQDRGWLELEIDRSSRPQALEVHNWLKLSEYLRKPGEI